MGYVPLPPPRPRPKKMSIDPSTLIKNPPPIKCIYCNSLFDSIPNNYKCPSCGAPIKLNENTGPSGGADPHEVFGVSGYSPRIGASGYSGASKNTAIGWSGCLRPSIDQDEVER